MTLTEEQVKAGLDKFDASQYDRFKDIRNCNLEKDYIVKLLADKALARIENRRMKETLEEITKTIGNTGITANDIQGWNFDDLWAEYRAIIKTRKKAFDIAKKALESQGVNI